MRSLLLSLQQYEWFIDVTKLWRSVQFRVRRAEHQIGERWRDHRHRSAALRNMMAMTTGSLLLAAVAVAAIAGLELLAVHFGWDLKSDSLVASYTEVMLGLAGMGGVFIGLYYAAVSAVATQAYADVPNELRYLLAGDVASRAYMGLLTFVTCFALLHVALGVVAPDYTSGIALIAALLLSAMSVILFVHLGNRAFHLLDPTAFSEELVGNLDRWVDRARVVRRRSAWPEFQQHARSQAEYAITTLDAIIERSIAMASRLGSVPTLCSQLLGVLFRYQLRKPEIPTDSRWYPQVLVQRRWFLSSDTYTSTAVQTGTALQPDARTDWFWVEERIDGIVRRILDVLSEQGRFRALLSCLSTLAEAVQRRARSGDVVGCVSAWARLNETLIPRIMAHARGASDDVLPLAVCDALSSLPVNIAIGFREYMDANPISSFDRYVAALRSSNPLRVGRYPFHQVDRVSWLRVRIDYEVLVEGNTVSPDWYHDELLRQVEVQHLEKCIQALLDTVPSHYETFGVTLQSGKHVTLEGAFLERRLEYLNKVRISLELVLKRFGDLSAVKRITGLPWPELDDKILRGKLVQREGELVDRMAIVSLELVRMAESETVPDYGGRFLAEVAAATFDAAADGNAEQFDKLFRALAIGSLRISNALRAKIGPNVATDPKLIAAVAATAEFLDIAGYAFVFSELHGRPEIWATTRSVLDAVFKKDVAQSSQYLAAVLSVSEYGWGIPHMASFRHQRSMEVSRRIEPLLSERTGLFAYGHVVKHSSPIVRAVADRMGFGPEGLDVFAFAYVHKELGAPLRNLSHRAQDIARKIDRQAEDDLEADDALEGDDNEAGDDRDGD